MAEPFTIYGICQKCGGRAADQSSGLTDADAVARDTTGNGMELEEYDGKYLCPMCISILKADDESLEKAREAAEDQKLMGKGGFTNTVS